LKLKDIAKLDQIVTQHSATYQSQSAGAGGAATAPQSTATTSAAPSGRVDLSAYSLNDNNSSRQMMRDILAGTNPALTQAFEQHCQDRLVDSEFTFLREIEAYKQNPSMADAQRLYDKYVAADSHYTLNLDGPERDAVSDQLRGANQAPGDLFDGPFGTVFDQMVNDQMSKFRAAN
jgi:hypothetical protein